MFLQKLFGNFAHIQRKRFFQFAFIEQAFNAVDRDRLKEVGPNRFCAEWILKHGGAVRLSTDPTVLLEDYNLLPLETVAFHVQEINAIDIAISALGFDHLNGCDHLNRILLDRCNNMKNEALLKLGYVQGSLNQLTIMNCPGVLDSGLLSLKQLTNLTELVCKNLGSVKSLKSIEEELKTALPNCNIKFS